MDNAIMIVKNCYDKSTDLSKTFVPCINEEIEKLPDSKDFQIRMKLKSAEKDNNEKYLFSWSIKQDICITA
ncbi:TPA: hypothetical protein ACT0KX_002570 [Legionella pneumophila]